MGNQVELPAVSATAPFRALKFNEARLYLLAGVFIALDVSVPWACHQFHPLAGPTFLPMHLFVILAALLFGWRAGLLVGLVTPLVSFAVSGIGGVGHPAGQLCCFRDAGISRVAPDYG